MPKKVSEVSILITARNLARGVLTNLQTGFGKLQGVIGSVTRGVFSLQTALVGLVSAGVGGFLLNINRQFEKFLVQLRTFEGSERAARRSFDRIEKFAADTSFQVGEL